jgi:hypothetical protein
MRTGKEGGELENMKSGWAMAEIRGILERLGDEDGVVFEEDNGLPY